MHNKFEFVTLKYLTNTHVCVCNCVFVRESSATSVTRAVDIWPSLSHPEKSSQSLRDLFSIADGPVHVSLPLAAGSTLLPNHHSCV